MADPGLMARMAPLIERFTALCETYGVEMLSEGGTFEAFKNQQLPVEALSGRRVLELPRQWAFKTDPDNLGESQGWFSQVPDDSWKPISIHEAWERQGYDRYDGYAWYRLKWTSRRSRRRPPGSSAAPSTKPSTSGSTANSPASAPATRNRFGTSPSPSTSPAS